MKRLFLLGFLVLGCNGGGSSSATFSLFDGTFVGACEDTELRMGGKLEVSISGLTVTKTLTVYSPAGCDEPRYSLTGTYSLAVKEDGPYENSKRVEETMIKMIVSPLTMDVVVDSCDIRTENGKSIDATDCEELISAIKDIGPSAYPQLMGSVANTPVKHLYQLSNDELCLGDQDDIDSDGYPKSVNEDLCLSKQ